MLTRFAENHPNFEFLRHTVNLGALANFRLLIESVETKYFLIISDDDFLMPNHINYGIQKLELHDCALSYMSATVTADMISRTFHFRNRGWIEGLYSPSESTVKRLVQEHFTSTGTIFRRCVREVFPDFPPLGDDHVSSVLLAGKFSHYITSRIGAVWTINEKRAVLYSGRRGSRKDIDKSLDFALAYINSLGEMLVKARLRCFVTTFYAKRRTIRSLYLISQNSRLMSNNGIINKLARKWRSLVLTVAMRFDTLKEFFDDAKLQRVTLPSRRVRKERTVGFSCDIPESTNGYLLNASITDRQHFTECIARLADAEKARSYLRL